MNSSEPRFLVDVGVGKGIERYLREEGYDTKAVRDIDPRMEDEEIVLTAVSENRIVVTMDKDFGELVYHLSTLHVQPHGCLRMTRGHDESANSFM